MKVLLIGGGGREHALAWKLKQSPRVTKIWCAPGNAGIAAEAECVNVDSGDVTAMVALAEKIRPDLTVVGPELPLVNGIADAFAARNWAIVGPTREAAKLEGSKIFSKEFLQRHNIPTAKMYGAYWCPHCADQKAMFGKSFRYVTYVECAIKDSHELAPTCAAAGVKLFPSWQFGANPPIEGVFPMQELSDKTGCSLP